MAPAGEKPDSGGLKGSWQAVGLLKPFFRRYRLRLAAGFLSLMLVN